MELAGDSLIRILAEGLSLYPTDYKNVETDLSAEERKSSVKHDGCLFVAEDRDLNSAEIYNLSERELSKVISYDIPGFLEQYKTRDFKIWKLEQIIGIAEYLQSVLKYGLLINAMVDDVKSEEHKTIEQPGNATSDAVFEAARNAVSGLLDILIEIKTRNDDLARSPYSHYLGKFYEELDSYTRTTLQCSPFPDMLCPAINLLYEGIPVTKFSYLIERKTPQDVLREQFYIAKERLYSLITVFCVRMVEEFAPYVTSCEFLNNPTGDAVFVVPLSIYKKFNFQRSGLIRSEMVCTDSGNLAKLVKRCNTLYKELQNLKDEAADALKRLKKQPEDDELACEFFLRRYEELFRETTEGNMGSFHRYLEHPAFREKFNGLIEMRQDLLQPVREGKNIWAEIWDETVHNKNLDKNTLIYFHSIFRKYFGYNEVISKCQVTRLLHMFSHSVSPVKSVTRYLNNFDNGKCVTWSDVLLEEFLELLEK